jgi:hypothetical protein
MTFDREERLEAIRQQFGEQFGEDLLVSLEGAFDGAIQRHVNDLEDAEDAEDPEAPWSPAGPVDTSLDADETLDLSAPGLVASGVRADPGLLEILGFIPEAPSIVAERTGPVGEQERYKADIAAMPPQPLEPPPFPSPRVHPNPPDNSTSYIEPDAPRDRPIFRNGRWITPRERGIREKP